MALLPLSAALVSACGGESPPPPSPPLADVALRDYGFILARDLPRGRVVLRARNAGAVRHELFLYSSQNARARKRAGGGRLVLTVARVPSLRPGETDSVAVDLRPGRYGLICLLKDADGTPHSKRGMQRELRVR